MTIWIGKWGRAHLTIGGLTLLSRCSDGSLTLASYHPRTSRTWHWAVGLTRGQPGLRRLLTITAPQFRLGQWHDHLRLPFGWALVLSRQDYHQR